MGRNFPYIDTFDHEGTAVVNAMYDLTSGLFEHLEITSPMDVDKRVAYTQRILRGTALWKYKDVQLKCKQLAKDLARDIWILGKLKELSKDILWTWAKCGGIGYSRDAYL